ncbi:thiamine biosynthesis protein ThiF [Chitinivibrio alkaliphilus ACht1]|uniref:Thiamine biosynthesis protein ThiF n=2 Tax=Chitinivibrio TaxID=1505231 RepID=U7D9S8_9BACT|nr:thiamine biosynthesis protein ThiF [Chitinivibrio alkaliphilus ACht1]
MNKYFKALYDDTSYRKITETTIGIAGTGGLGSNCAMNLVRSGFTKFFLYDFDTVDYSNLNRQFFFRDQVGKAKVDALQENLLRIEPSLDITCQKLRITPENISSLFTECTVVVEAFDEVAAKRMIVESFLNSPKLLVAASGLAGYGNTESITVQKIKDTFYFIGDFTQGVTETTPPLSPRVNMVAALQADTILTHILTT